MTAQVIIYSRPGCCLCEEAEAVLRRVHSQRPFELHVANIEDDETLLRRYLERIPVVTLDGEELFEFYVDEAELQRSLDRVLGP